MRAIDTQSGRELWNDGVWESRSWATEWQTFSGDDRALNGSSLKSADLFPPSRRSLYDSMRDELADDVARAAAPDVCQRVDSSSRAFL